MKQAFIFILTIICFSSLAQSITISPNGTSALIEANSTTKGFLPPRMNMEQRAALTLTPGLQVYCSDCSPAGPYSYDGTQWKAMFNIGNATATTYTVGQHAQGGIVIWVDDSGQHGIVAGPTDVLPTDYPDGLPWARNEGPTHPQTVVLAIGGGVYDGQENTTNIINKKGWGVYAAFLCRQMAFEGYGGWYLPSLYELRLIYQNRVLLNIVPPPLGGYYWSSTENGADEAYAIDFSTGLQFTYSKISDLIFQVSNRARAVRRF